MMAIVKLLPTPGSGLVQHYAYWRKPPILKLIEGNKKALVLWARGFLQYDAWTVALAKGLDNVTLPMCKHQQRFGLEVLCSVFCFLFIFGNYILLWLWSDGTLNTSPSPSPNVSSKHLLTFHTITKEKYAKYIFWQELHPWLSIVCSIIKVLLSWCLFHRNSYAKT